MISVHMPYVLDQVRPKGDGEIGLPSRCSLLSGIIELCVRIAEHIMTIGVPPVLDSIPV